MAQGQLIIKLFLLTFILKNHFKFVHSETDLKRTWLASNGVECASPCATKGKNYFWCYLVDFGWHYCSKDPLLDYKGNKCENKCGRHGKKYDWCWTGNGDWGYCSREGSEVYVKHFGSTSGKECSSTCTQHGGTWYYWCQIDKSKWDYCSPNEGRNYAGTECKTSCQKSNGTSYHWCNDHRGKWQYCSPVSTNFSGKCSATTLRSSQTLPVRASMMQKVSKRDAPARSSQSSPSTNSIVYSENMDLCQDLVTNLLAANPKLKQITPGGGPHNPVLQVWYSGEDDKERLPHMIHAVIHQHHRRCPKTTFGATFNKQMEFMNNRDDDEKSHVVSSKFCGPAEWYNLAPQKNHLEQSRGGGSWRSQQEWFAEMLDTNPCVYLDQWIVLIYDDVNRRPGHFQLCYAFKDVVTNRVMLGPDAKLFRNE